MATSHDERIRKLQEQLEQAKAAKRRADAKVRATASKKSRAEDTRRKVLIGAMVMSQMERSQQKKLEVLSGLDTYLTRQADRDLFELGAYKLDAPTFLPDDHADGSGPPTPTHFREVQPQPRQD